MNNTKSMIDFFEFHNPSWLEKSFYYLPGVVGGTVSTISTTVSTIVSTTISTPVSTTVSATMSTSVSLTLRLDVHWNLLDNFFDNFNVLDDGNLDVFHNMYWDFDVFNNWVRLGYMDVFIDRYMFDMVNRERFGHDDDLMTTPVSTSVSSLPTTGADGCDG